MKKWIVISFIWASSAIALESPAPKIGVVNFKACVEGSKIGKEEQAAFETMKKQMENALEEKRRPLSKLADKLSNQDEIELMSVEAEVELKRQFRALDQEAMQLESQCYQTLNQFNMQQIQKLSEMVAEGSQEVAKEEKLDMVLNSEGAFFTSKGLDVSPLVIKKMDIRFDKEKATAAQAQGH